MVFNDKKAILKLIEMYKTYECLWNYKNKNYKKPSLKMKALQNLANEFNVPPDQIKKKIKYLRASYVNERKKVYYSEKCGKGLNDIYIPSLFYYKEFQFLDEVIVFRQSTNDFEEDSKSDVQTFNETHVELAQDNSSIQQKELNESQTEILQEYTRYNRGKEEDENLSRQSTVKDIKRKAHPDEYVTIKKQSSNSSKRDEFDVFGEYVAYTLRNLERKSIQSRAKFEISNILYRAEVYDDDQQPCAFSDAFTSNPASSVDTAQLSSGTWEK